jgi:hypothetical protein
MAWWNWQSDDTVYRAPMLLFSWQLAGLHGVGLCDV